MMAHSKQPSSEEGGHSTVGVECLRRDDGAGCLLGGSLCVGSSSRCTEGTPWDAPPVPGSVEERPARSDVRVMAAPRGQIRAIARPSIGVEWCEKDEGSSCEREWKASDADEARKSKKAHERWCSSRQIQQARNVLCANVNSSQR